MTHWIQISAGRGPAECCWVVAKVTEFLFTQADNFDCQLRLLDRTKGPFNNIYRSTLLSLDGNDEQQIRRFIEKYEGTVQWIGRSMYRPEYRRKNWFIEVKAFTPVEQKTIAIDKVKIERMRSSGPGGQHTNKTESAVRVTHLTTGLSAYAQEERSQHRNTSLAMARLQELLHQQEEEKMQYAKRLRWTQHNGIQRGNAVHVFTSSSFQLRNN